MKNMFLQDFLMFETVYQDHILSLPAVGVSLAAVHGEVAGAAQVDDLLVLLAGLVLA